MARAVAHALTALRRWRGDMQVAALERRISQDPGDIGQRCQAVAHYCQQLKLLADMSARGHGHEGEDELLHRATSHMEHVLEACDDINRLHSVLSQAVGPKLFYKFPRLTARYMRKIGLHQECLEEFDTRSEFEERATPYHFANALAILKATGERDAAEELFQEAKDISWKGRHPITWQKLEQTPAVHIQGLEHRPYWEGESRPGIAALLQENHACIMEDLQEMLALRTARKALQVPAYPNLVDGQEGVWDMLQLYVGRRWNEDLCDLMPRTSTLLRSQFPSADVPYIHYNTEEVVVFLLAPGSRVHLHNGGSNVPINVSLGLSGCEGSFLEVAGEKRPFRDGQVLCFDDGTDHRVWHEGPQERWVITVRSMHPQLAASPSQYFSRAFTRRTCFETWDEKRARQLCEMAQL
eukprot:TRINITY_DN94344_c0_g1_i1.p1 TRINITY_DN94344_c0_g1~~TRINITY_DN94344_c0_g1_i1.p1  ORF type:complete len:418 (-),score=87.56 TRINITY_DN94344_c0_g1_i1:40-1272(-)